MKNKKETEVFFQVARPLATEILAVQTSVQFFEGIDRIMSIRRGILRQRFRTLIKSICSGIHHFKVACTAASGCKFIYRQLLMPMNAIGISPFNGYRSRNTKSFPAWQWLNGIESQ